MQLRVEALQLLHHFLALPPAKLQTLSQQVEELVNGVFPASSWELKQGSTQSIHSAQQLMALMDSMVAAAERGLSVEPILEVGSAFHFFPIITNVLGTNTSQQTKLRSHIQ